MSNRNGDRAKFNREHKKRMRRRKRARELRKTLGSKTPGQEAPIHTEDGNQAFSSRLRQVTGDSKADSDQGGHALEIVVYKSSSEGTK
jgi:hypothetical protein